MPFSNRKTVKSAFRYLQKNLLENRLIIRIFFFITLTITILLHRMLISTIYFSLVMLEAKYIRLPKLTKKLNVNN